MEFKKTGTMVVPRSVRLMRFIPSNNGDKARTVEISFDRGNYPVARVENPFGPGLDDWIILTGPRAGGEIIGVAEGPLSKRDGVKLTI